MSRHQLNFAISKTENESEMRWICWCIALNNHVTLFLICVKDYSVILFESPVVVT